MPEQPDSRDDRRHNFRFVFARGNVGPRVLADLMAYAMVLDPGMEPDARSQDFHAGRRDVVCYILDCMGVSKDYEEIARAMAKARVKEPEPLQTEGDTNDVDGWE